MKDSLLDKFESEELQETEVLATEGAKQRTNFTTGSGAGTWIHYDNGLSSPDPRQDDDLL